MRSATKSKPRFRVGEWVSYRNITCRVLAQIIEDRDLIGHRGRRLYEVRLDRSQPDPSTTTIAEEDLEKAPSDLLSGEEAQAAGLFDGQLATSRVRHQVRPQGQDEQLDGHTCGWPRVRGVVRAAESSGSQRRDGSRSPLATRRSRSSQSFWSTIRASVMRVGTRLYGPRWSKKPRGWPIGRSRPAPQGRDRTGLTRSGRIACRLRFAPGARGGDDEDARRLDPEPARGRAGHRPGLLPDSVLPRRRLVLPL